MSEKTTLLFVDDEERILRSLRMLFRGTYEVLTTTDGNEALRILGERRVHVLVSDQRMPLMTGVELLSRARDVSPSTMRLLLTGYSELDAVVGSVNEGEIFRFINKPWDAAEIKATVEKAAAIAHKLFDAEQFGMLPLPVSGDDEADSGHHVLVLDRDFQTRDTVEAALKRLGEQYVLHWGRSVDEAFGLMAEYDISLVLSEIYLGDEAVTGALKSLKQQYPEIVTLVLTSFKDTQRLIELINQGQIYRFLPKPLSVGLLAKSLSAAIVHQRAIEESPVLAERHSVEPARETADRAVADRIRGFLDRIRRRRPGAPAYES